MSENEATGRNEPCPCGSGKKYKRCCGVGAAPKLSTPTQANFGGANPAELMKQMDPEMIARFSEMLHRLPKGQIQRIQALTQKAMSGKDVTSEAQELEKILPVELQQMVQGLNLPGLWGAADQTPTGTSETVETDEMNEDAARKIVEEAVRSGKVSKEEGEALLGKSKPGFLRGLLGK